MWSHRAPVQNVLAIFDFDVSFPGFYELLRKLGAEVELET